MKTLQTASVDELASAAPRSKSEARVYYDRDEVKLAANGRWAEIHCAVTGIADDYLIDRHIPCPKCGGTDRWRFTDLNGDGGAICNQSCGKMGDGFAVMLRMNGTEFSEALRLVAEYLGVPPREKTKSKSKTTPSEKDPLSKVGFKEWNDSTAAYFCFHKKGITPDGMRACGANFVKYQFKKSVFNCVAIRILGEGLNIDDPAGLWIIESFGAKLPTKNGEVKHKCTFGSAKGIAMTNTLADALRTGRELSGLTIYKTEGLPDLLSIGSQGEGILAFSSANGAEEKPLAWLVDQLARAKPSRVVVIPDADEPGLRGADTWAKTLAKKIDDVRVARLPFEVKPTHGSDLRDYFAGGGTLPQINEIARLAEPTAGNQKGRVGADGRIMVEFVDNESDMIQAILPALKDVPNLYQRGGQLVETVVSTHPIAKEVKAIRVEPIALSKLRARVSGRVALFQDTGEEDRPVRMNDTIARQVRDWGTYADVPELYGVSEYPFLRPDGTICKNTGYDEATQTYLQTNLSVDVPESPSYQDAQASVGRLLELVSEFDFEGGSDSASRSAWLAGLLTLFARPAIGGCVPMWIIEASIQGSGKTRLVDVIAMIAFGHALTRNSWPVREEEVSKSLTAIAVSGIPAVLFDNVKTLLGGPALEAFATSETWKSRILGESRETTELPIRQTVFSTGNNCSFSLDIARRACFVRLEPQCEDPSSRTFKIPDLLNHVKKRRNELASDVLTILRGFWVSGFQPKMDAWGGFESWSDLVRGSLIWMDLPDPYAGTSRAKDEATSADLLPELISAMDSAGINGETSQEILRLANSMIDGRMLQPELRDVLDSGCHGKKLNSKLIGNFLKRFEGRIHSDRKISSKIDSHKKIKQWFVSDVSIVSDQSCGVAGLCTIPHRPTWEESKVKSENLTSYSGENAQGSPQNTAEPRNPANDSSTRENEEVEF